MTPTKSDGAYLLQRIRTIRQEALSPRDRSFNLDYQLSRFIDDLERAFGLRSSNLDAVAPSGLASAPKQGTWQPIETAPKDGSTILVRQGDWTPVRAFWRLGANGDWRVLEYLGPRPLTHWMPVPSPALVPQE